MVEPNFPSSGRTAFSSSGSFGKLCIKLSALFAFCGGPLFFLNRNQTDKDDVIAFIFYFSPVALTVFGYLALLQDEALNAIDRGCAWLGAVAMFVLVGASLYAMGAIASGSQATAATEEHTDDTGLVLIGCLVTYFSAAIYATLVRSRLFQNERGNENSYASVTMNHNDASAELTSYPVSP